MTAEPLITVDGLWTLLLLGLVVMLVITVAVCAAAVVGVWQAILDRRDRKRAPATRVRPCEGCGDLTPESRCDHGHHLCDDCATGICLDCMDNAREADWDGAAYYGESW